MATVDTLIPNLPAPQAQKKTAHEFWSEYLCSIIHPLLQASGSYTAEQQLAQLRFLVDHVAPTLGPLPSEPRATYTQTYVDSPFEPSLNLTANGKVKVRYGLEVVKPASGPDGPDPFGEHRAREVLLQLAKASGADTQWLNSAMEQFFMTPEETENMRGKLPSFMPSSLLAFDLDGNKTMMKLYVIAMRKAIASGSTSSNQFTLDALRRMQPYGEKLGPGLDVISDNSFAVASDVMTLGGRLTDETTLKRVEILRTLWPLLRNEKPGEGPDPSDAAWDAWEKPERITGTPLSGLQYNVELNPSKPGLEMKSYVPLFQHNASAQESEANMERILRKLEHEWGSNGKYSAAIKAAYGKDRVSPTFVSFSYSKSKGPYMSSYVPGTIDVGAEMKAGNWEYS
ncbi:tryptophan dimethylallyltransferase-domain-containing protein [Parachaetomium inaequale]|uniref:Tryptophan dimethylallyltransferase-domain-containing protein n=1 Tax=Parachaetomium inaequale TaxID=2588326 RepID=A0AAN6SSV5_9PEZI|nr:tryptophan dimethylallyltransferase-domain-containing protein [Parachaetomium inaequale]